VHTIPGVVVTATLAFAGTTFDNFFAFAAQLIVTDPARRRRVSVAHAFAMAALLVVAAAVGAALAPIPVRWIGAFGVAMFAFALATWRRRDSPREQFRRGGLTTFAVTLALGGDSLAVWIALFRANGVTHGLVMAGVFAIGEGVFLVSAQRVARHPRVVVWGRRQAPRLLPVVYLALGVLILWECHTL
jgi:cadmium resistance protein CadD (predicted permease)